MEETGGLGDNNPPAGIPCGKFEAEGLTSVEMMIFIPKHAAKLLANGKKGSFTLLK